MKLLKRLFFVLLACVIIAFLSLVWFANTYDRSLQKQFDRSKERQQTAEIAQRLEEETMPPWHFVSVEYQTGVRYEFSLDPVAINQLPTHVSELDQQIQSLPRVDHFRPVVVFTAQLETIEVKALGTNAEALKELIPLLESLPKDQRWQVNFRIDSNEPSGEMCYSKDSRTDRTVQKLVEPYGNRFKIAPVACK